MTKIYTLTLAPSLDSATQTPQIYPEGKLRCSAPVFWNLAAAGSMWPAP
ncbi:6-phosphofructokinase class II [Klebsiella pneumoniae]|uniref:6-phosphofructokinase class II n=1 Tax=Klebsiella pneumoniae TaxID=573 RepID=A0A447S7H0_KLEPN|nr:6-phosphofructokinase class II [Klebsiella pneumoniae]